MPNSVMFKSSDPYEHQRAIRAAEISLIVTAPGRFRADLTRIDLHQLWMQRSRELLPRIAHSAVRGDRNVIFFLADTNQASIYHTGIEIQPGHIVFDRRGAEHHHRSSSACYWGSMSLTPDDLAAAGQAVAGYDLIAPKVTRMIRPPDNLMSRLLRLHETAGHLAANVPDLLAHPEVSKAIEQELVLMMARCLTEGLKAADANVGHQRLPVMRRFEQVLEANQGKPIYLAEICMLSA